MSISLSKDGEFLHELEEKMDVREHCMCTVNILCTHYDSQQWLIV